MPDITFDHDGARWTLAPGYTPDQVHAVLRGSAGPQTEQIKGSLARTVAFVPLDPGRRVALKHYKCRGARDVLKAIVAGSKARHEWNMARRLLDAGIPTAPAVAFGERRRAGVAVESWLITQEIAPCVPLRDLLATPTKLGPELRESLRAQLGQMLARLHTHGIYHRDLHAGNFLVRSAEGEATLYLLDLHAARVRAMGMCRRDVVQNLAMVCAFGSYPGVEPADERRVLKHYQDAGGQVWGDPDALCAAVHTRLERLRARRLSSRAKRCLINSTEFCTHRDAGRRVYRRRDFPPEAVQAAVEAHAQACVPGNPAMVKIDTKTHVSFVHVPGPHGPRSVCVKEYCGQPLLRRLRNLFRPRPALRSWMAAHALRVRDIAAPQHLAVALPANPLSGQGSYLISDRLQHAVGLDRYATAHLAGPEARSRRRAFAQAVGRHFARLHEQGVYHRDLKASNILVHEDDGGWVFHLVDLDRVRFLSPVDRRRRVLNLAQINASTPRVLSNTDRLAALRAYQAQGPLGEEARAFLRDAIEQTRLRHCIWEP